LDFVNSVSFTGKLPYDDVKSRFPDFNYDAQGSEYGYDFAVEADPSVKLFAEMDIMSESPQCYLTNTTSLVPQNSYFHYVQLCRDTYPKGDVKVTIWELSVLMENAWQVIWNRLGMGFFCKNDDQ